MRLFLNAESADYLITLEASLDILSLTQRLYLPTHTTEADMPSSLKQHLVYLKTPTQLLSGLENTQIMD